MTPPAPASQETNARVAALMTFAAFLGLGIVIPFLPLFVAELGVQDRADAAQWAGALIGVGPLLAGLLAPFWGGLADRHGYRRIALLALVALGLSQLVAFLAQNPGHLLASRVLSGLFGGVGPLGLAMAAAAGTNGAASSHIGRIQAAQILAAGFGPLLGGALASALGVRVPFVAAALCCFGAAIAVAVYYRDPHAPQSAVKPDGARPAATLGPFFLSLLLVVFFVNFASRSFTPILPAQLADLGVAPKGLAVSTGLLISTYSVAAALSSFAFGRMAGRRDPSRLLAVSLVLSLGTAVAMGEARNFSLFLAIAFVYGLVSGGGLTLGYSIGSRHFTEEQRGASFGRLSGAALVGGAVAPSIAALVARSSIERVYWMNGVIYLVLAVVALAALRPSDATSARS